MNKTVDLTKETYYNLDDFIQLHIKKRRKQTIRIVVFFIPRSIPHQKPYKNIDISTFFNFKKITRILTSLLTNCHFH